MKDLGFGGFRGLGAWRAWWYENFMVSWLEFEGLVLAGPRALGLYFESLEALPSVIWASLCSGSTVPDGRLPC